MILTEEIRKLDNIPLKLQYEILHTIESQQQTIKQLENKIIKINSHNSFLTDKNIELKQENEQLQAKAAGMREALTEIFTLLEEHEPNWYLRKHYNIIKNALSSTDYHNPADVAEIEQLKDENASIRKWNTCVEEDRPKLLKENERLQYTLIGVMHSVDKWFDEVDESIDEVNRAAQAREIALQAIEKRDKALEQAKKALYSALEAILDNKLLVDTSNINDAILQIAEVEGK